MRPSSSTPMHSWGKDGGGLGGAGGLSSSVHESMLKNNITETISIDRKHPLSNHLLLHRADLSGKNDRRTTNHCVSGHQTNQIRHQLSGELNQTLYWHGDIFCYMYFYIFSRNWIETAIFKFFPKVKMVFIVHIFENPKLCFTKESV